MPTFLCGCYACVNTRGKGGMGGGEVLKGVKVRSYSQCVLEKYVNFNYFSTLALFLGRLQRDRTKGIVSPTLKLQNVCNCRASPLIMRPKEKYFMNQQIGRLYNTGNYLNVQDNSYNLHHPDNTGTKLTPGRVHPPWHAFCSFLTRRTLARTWGEN